jgi:hypothetical protein
MTDLGAETLLDDQFNTLWYQLVELIKHARVTIAPQHRQEALALYKNPCNRDISLVPGRGFLVQRTHMFHGVASSLAKYAWPQPMDVNNSTVPSKHARHDPRRRAKLHGQALGVQGSQVAVGTLRKSDQCKLSAVDHGSIVHDEVRTVLDQLIRAFFEGVCTRPTGMRFDPCSIHILQTLLQLQWIPIASEWQIWHAEWRLATAVDAVVYDMTTQEFVMVELKNGYEHEVYDEMTTDVPMQAPFQTVQDCPKNRHLLQLFLTFAITHLQQQYRNSPTISRCVVLRRMAAHKCITVVDLDMNWALASMPLAIAFARMHSNV